MTRQRRRIQFISLAGLLVACKIPNPEHCLHKAADSNRWCAENSPSRTYCSPCEAVNHGCVALEPDPLLCPSYHGDADAGLGSDQREGTDGASEGPGRVN